MPDICAGHKQSHMGETVSRVQYGVQAVCYLYDRMCSADGGADSMCAKDTGSKTWCVPQKTGCSGMHLPLPPPPSHVCCVIAITRPSPTAIQPAHHRCLAPTTNGVPCPHPCFPVRTHASYVHTNPHPPGFVLPHPPPPFLHAYRRPLLTPTIALSPPPTCPSPHHPPCPPPILALTGQDQLKNQSSTGLDRSGHVTSLNQLIDRL